jgi:hypothetical protein
MRDIDRVYSNIEEVQKSMLHNRRKLGATSTNDVVYVLCPRPNLAGT